MNKSTKSILLTAVLAASGFAFAQAPVNGAPVKPDTSGVSASGTTRAEVKSEIGMAPKKAVNGPAVTPDMSGKSAAGTTRAEVKAEAGATASAPVNGDAAKTTTVAKKSMTSAERKRMRAERRAKAKAKRDAGMMAK